MDQETARLLIEQKIAFFDTMAIVCITWWTSSVFFVGTMLAGIFVKRDEVVRLSPASQRHLNWAVSSFLTTVVTFGIGVIVYLSFFQSSLEPALTVAKANPRFFSNEVTLFLFGMFIGTLNFALSLLLWHSLLRRLTAAGRVAAGVDPLASRVEVL